MEIDDTYFKSSEVEVSNTDTSNLEKDKMAVNVRWPLSNEKVGCFVGQTSGVRRIDAQVCIKAVLGRYARQHPSLVPLTFGNSERSKRRVNEHTWVSVEDAYNIKALADLPEHNL